MGPRPAEINNSAAQTSSGIARKALSSQRVGLRSQAGSCFDMRLAGTAKAKPKTAAMMVPSADMASVSQAAETTLLTNLGDISGGKNSAIKRYMLRPASKDAKEAQSRSKDTKLEMTNTSKASVNQQALHRASNKGGGSL
jgi:hypothetical protein